MAAFSDYLENELLDHILRAATYTAPSSVWIALHTADNGLEAGTLTGEVSGGAYARVEVGGASGRTFSAAASGTTDNDQDITFTTATADWGTVTHMSIMDASTAGNVLFHGSLTVSKTVNNGDTFKFNAGDLDVTLA
jgi:hypothetical protein